MMRKYVRKYLIFELWKKQSWSLCIRTGSFYMNLKNNMLLHLCVYYEYIFF